MRCGDVPGVGNGVTLGVLAGVGAVELRGVGLVEGTGVAAGVVCGVSCRVPNFHVPSGRTKYEVSPFSFNFVAGREISASSLDLCLFRLSFSSYVSPE